ncbi:hypothetical protein OXPF_05490 [Oxobacter pfennigii]|uniref:DUF3221 domain-containing protein n=1 Tax=Oxobacter pfennigii TaxID=36849 RepID=A0A0P8X5H4_9CLOT|nr:hypothetical protein [Oxobacter pfennigii]KPU46066.1 hypothetical protein OXPF_05490 [Oxobacter pfennigii]
MKKIALFLIGVSMVLMISACFSEKGTAKNELSDYRPMIYVQDALYGGTADVISILPDEAVYIGTVEKVVPQNEPMVRENFVSNTLSAGSEIYYSESDPNVIYVKLSDTSQEQYSKYIAIE